MNVLLADRLTPEAIDGLRALGLTVTDTPELNVDSLADALEGVDVLVVNETPVTRRAIERATQLLLIIITSPKQGHVDLEAASDNAVAVVECAPPEHDARAEFAFYQMLHLDRSATKVVASGDNEPPRGLRGACLGLLGLSPSGERVARLARSFGMTVRVFAPELSTAIASELGVTLSDSPQELVSRAHFISHHGDYELSPEVIEALVGPKVFVSVDNIGPLPWELLLKAASERNVSIAVDSLDDDDALDALEEAANVSITRGAAGLTQQSTQAMGHAVVEVLHEMLTSGDVKGGVNIAAQSKPAATLLIRQAHHAGALTALFDELSESDIPVLDIQSRLFSNGSTASLSIKLGRVPSPRVLEQIKRHGHVRRLDVVNHLGE